MFSINDINNEADVIHDATNDTVNAQSNYDTSSASGETITQGNPESREGFDNNSVERSSVASDQLLPGEPSTDLAPVDSNVIDETGGDATDSYTRFSVASDEDTYQDAAGIKKGAFAHNTQTIRLLARLRDEGFDGLVVGAGNCTLCSPCRMSAGEPCLHPEDRFSCMSAYCVDVAGLAEKCGLEFAWDPAKLHSYGMILFHSKRQ